MNQVSEKRFAPVKIILVPRIVALSVVDVKVRDFGDETVLRALIDKKFYGDLTRLQKY